MCLHLFIMATLKGGVEGETYLNMETMTHIFREFLLKGVHSVALRKSDRNSGVMNEDGQLEREVALLSLRMFLVTDFPPG